MLRRPRLRRVGLCKSVERRTTDDLGKLQVDGPRKLRGVNVIEVYADVWCPFAYVGLLCVVERRAQLEREDVFLNIRAWPLELVNGAPLDPEATARPLCVFGQCPSGKYLL